MSSTNKTSNLELSQFIGTDSPKWLTDYNSDMQKIDAGYGSVKSQADATDLVVAGHTSSIQANTQSLSDQQSAITALRADVTAAQGSINTINSLIGDGEPTTSNKTIIGAINELAAEIPSPTTQLPATSISYDNTDSGLTATNVQAAIDELKDDIDAIPTTSSSSIHFPNWSDTIRALNAPSISYTMPRDGWIIGAIQSASGGDAPTITVNGIIVAYAYANPSTTVVACGVCVPVKAGDVIATSGAAGSTFNVNIYGVN